MALTISWKTRFSVGHVARGAGACKGHAWETGHCWSYFQTSGLWATAERLRVGEGVLRTVWCTVRERRPK